MAEDFSQRFWIVRTLGRQRYLLLALVALLVALPTVTSGHASQLWVTGVLTLVLIAGPLSLSHTPLPFYVSLVLGCIMVGTRWAYLAFDIGWIKALRDAGTVLFFLLLSVLIFYQFLLRNRRVTSQTLIAAVNAYLCIGIMYAFVYFYIIEHQPGAFRGDLLAQPTFDVCVYLSFVTMTTLGYGDITPQTNFAAVITWTQAVVGQLYIALTIARVVGTMASQEPGPPADQ